MNQRALFDTVSYKVSNITARKYSTSFSAGIRMLRKDQRDGISAIYGFTRFADEIVDTFHEHDKAALLEQFERDTYQAIESRISLNPILNSFQLTVNKYNIDYQLIDQFLTSMKMDLVDQFYDRESYEYYILGSAEVVGLMCLQVFVEGNTEQYEALKPSAMKLGAAFQKVNFLRDMAADYELLGRTYFPGLDFEQLDDEHKSRLEKEIVDDFAEAYKGILRLPKSARFGVYLAYRYYRRLFRKIQMMPASTIKSQRVRISNSSKVALLARSYVKHSFNLL